MIAKINDQRNEQSPGLYIVAWLPQTSFIELESQPVGKMRMPNKRNNPKLKKKRVN